MAKTFKVDDEVRGIIMKCEISETSVRLPVGQLDRKLYDRINKVFKAAGGAWNKKTQSHVFDRDPREALGITIQTGVAKNVQQELQAFYTPLEVAHKVVAYAGCCPGMTVLEPSAGMGAIASVARESGANVICCERDQIACERLKRDRFVVVEGDFLLSRQVLPMPIDGYHAVVMNPPFSDRQDIEHVMTAFSLLRPGGVLVSVMGTSFLFRDNGRYKQFRGWYSVHSDMDHETLPAGTFSQSGTNIETVIIRLRNEP